MSVVWQDPGGSATGGTEFLTTGGTGITAQTSVLNGQAYAYLLDTLNPAVGRAPRWHNAILQAAGNRISMYFRLPVLPANAIDFRPIFVTPTGSGTGLLNVIVDNAGKLRLYTNSVVTQIGATGATVLAANTWYRITLSYAITTTTNWSAKLYIGNTLEMTRTNADATLSSALPTDLASVVAATAGVNAQMYVSDIYVDDTTDQTDPAAGIGNGEMHVGRRAVTTVSSGAWDTSTGTGALTERPVNTANRIGELATGPATVDYNVEAASAGDANLTGATILGRSVFAWWTLGSLTGTPTGHLRIDGADLGSVMDAAVANTYELKVVIDSVTTYPSTIGCTSSGLAADTLVAELGVVVAYIPAAAAAPILPPFPLRQIFVAA